MGLTSPLLVIDRAVLAKLAKSMHAKMDKILAALTVAQLAKAISEEIIPIRTTDNSISLGPDAILVNDKIADAIGLTGPTVIPDGGFRPKDGGVFVIIKEHGAKVFRKSIFAKYAGRTAVPASKFFGPALDNIDDVLREIIRLVSLTAFVEAVNYIMPLDANRERVTRFLGMELLKYNININYDLASLTRKHLIT